MLAHTSTIQDVSALSAQSEVLEVLLLKEGIKRSRGGIYSNMFWKGEGEVVRCAYFLFVYIKCT